MILLDLSIVVSLATGVLELSPRAASAACTSGVQSPDVDSASDAELCASGPAPQAPNARHTSPGATLARLPWSGPADAVDVPYAPFSARNVFDWYAPPFELAGGAGQPVLVWAHGGGFDERGSEALSLDEAPFGALHARGYAIVAVRFRQRPSGVFGAEMARDVGSVVQLLRANAASYHIDPNAIVGYGSSSGALTLGLLAFGPDYHVQSSADPVLRESSRIDAFLNDRCESDWLHYVDNQIVNHPFNAFDLTGVSQSEKELASALWWLQQPGAHTVPTLSIYRSRVHTPPLVNLHDGWLGEQLNNALVALGETHCSFHVTGTAPIPWSVVERWCFDVFGY